MRGGPRGQFGPPPGMRGRGGFGPPNGFGMRGPRPRGPPPHWGGGGDFGPPMMGGPPPHWGGGGPNWDGPPGAGGGPPMHDDDEVCFLLKMYPRFTSKIPPICLKNGSEIPRNYFKNDSNLP